MAGYKVIFNSSMKNYLQNLIIKILFSFLISILVAGNASLLSAKESSYAYNEAYRIEKISPILAINLYEKILEEKNGSKKVLQNSINRLFYLYIKTKRFEEIFILNSKFPPNKIRQKKTDQIIRNISFKLKIDESAFKEMVSISLRNDKESRSELLSIHNYFPNHYLLRYIFAIKFQTGDLDTLAYLISEIPDINPVLKLVYIIKASKISTTATSIEKAVRSAASISSLTNAQKSDILYFYAKYLRNKRRYRQSIRYFHMSATYAKNEEGFIADGMTEAAKTLFTTGNKKEACAIVQNKIDVQTETDAVISLFCKNKNNLKLVKSSIKHLSELDPDPVYKRALKVINE